MEQFESVSTKKLSILVVEDQSAIAENIANYFELSEHILDFAVDGEQGVVLALSNYYDIIILDIMLPGIDGLTVCQKIRQKSSRHIPILMLTARDSIADKVIGFESGADDYLTKPFALEELEVRVVALSRRYLLQTEHVIKIGSLTVDRQLKKVTRESQELKLNSVSYQILEALAESHPKVLTRSELVHRIWGDEPTESDALRSHIYQLRNLLDKPFSTKILKTVHGVGFALESDS